MNAKYFLFAVLFAISPTQAHHSDVGVDMESIVAFEGTVREFNWRNPHIYIIVETTDAAGNSVNWNVQMGSVSISLRSGWTPDFLKPGDRVTVRVNPKSNGQPYGILESLQKEDGQTLASSFKNPESVASADSINGKWIADRTSYPDYPGGYDGLFKALLSLNEKAEQAALDFDPFSEDNPDATCIGRPTPGAFVSTSLYLMEIEIKEEEDIVIIRSERDAEERTVYMDGRSHPSADIEVAQGHSIGWWEEDTLVVDTTNFPFHRSPYQLGVPSSTQKHVVERYRLNEAGTHLEAEFTLEDPEYLTKPMTHSRLLTYSPNTEIYLSKCDPESASAFMRF